MLSSFRLGTALAAGLVIAGFVTAQNTPNNRHALHNGGDVVFIYGDPTIGASAGSGGIDTSGDLYWMVTPRQAMISSTQSTEMSGAFFGLFDTDWTDSAFFFDMLFGPGTPNALAPGNIAPDFSVAGLTASTLLNMGGSSGFPNPCTASPGFCTSIGGTSICPPSGSVVGYFTSVQLLSACDGTGILFTANNTVDNVVTAFLPGGMTFATGGPGQCGLGNYTLQTEASNNETQADNAPTTGISRYGGFQIGAAPALNPDGVAERSVYNVEYCEPMVNTSFNGDRGTVGMHVDASTSSQALASVVSDTLGTGPTNLAFVSSCLLAPFPPPGLPIFGAGVMLNITDPTVSTVLKKGVIAHVDDFPASGYPFSQEEFTPGVAIPVLTSTSLTLSSQAIILDLISFTARGSVLTKTGINN
jgi:hypothetical protein